MWFHVQTDTHIRCIDRLNQKFNRLTKGNIWLFLSIELYFLVILSRSNYLNVSYPASPDISWYRDARVVSERPDIRAYSNGVRVSCVTASDSEWSSTTMGRMWLAPPVSCFARRWNSRSHTHANTHTRLFAHARGINARRTARRALLPTLSFGRI